MFDADAGLDARVAEDDVQELRQLASRDLGGVADDRAEARFIVKLAGLDPAEDMIPDRPLPHALSRELHGLLDADVLRFGARVLLAAVDAVCDGEAVAGEQRGWGAGFLDYHGTGSI